MEPDSRISKMTGAEVVHPISLLHPALPGDRINLPDSTVVVFSRRKLVVTTSVGERDGTVKELFSSGDWGVGISGVYIGETPQDALHAMAELNNLFDIDDALEVEHSPLAAVGVTRLVLTDVEISRPEGDPTLVLFRLTALSDDTYTFTLTNPA